VEVLEDAEQNIFGQIAFGMDEADYVMMRAPLVDYFDTNCIFSSSTKKRQIGIEPSPALNLQPEK
jgi:hypothetical protein